MSKINPENIHSKKRLISLNKCIIKTGKLIRVTEKKQSDITLVTEISIMSGMSWLIEKRYRLKNRGFHKKIVVAPDAYKGTLTQVDAENIIKNAIMEVDATHNVVIKPMADGGEGMLDALLRAIPDSKR